MFVCMSLWVSVLTLHLGWDSFPVYWCFRQVRRPIASGAVLLAPPSGMLGVQMHTCITSGLYRFWIPVLMFAVKPAHWTISSGPFAFVYAGFTGHRILGWLFGFFFSFFFLLASSLGTFTPPSYLFRWVSSLLYVVFPSSQATSVNFSFIHGFPLCYSLISGMV